MIAILRKVRQKMQCTNLNKGQHLSPHFCDFSIVRTARYNTPYWKAIAEAINDIGLDKTLHPNLWRDCCANVSSLTRGTHSLLRSRKDPDELSPAGNGRPLAHRTTKNKPSLVKPSYPSPL